MERIGYTSLEKILAANSRQPAEWQRSTRRLRRSF